MKIVKLSVHKNNKQQRESKQLRTKAVRMFKDCINQQNVSGYAIVTWDRDGLITSCSDITNKESNITSATLPETLKTIFLDRYLNE